MISLGTGEETVYILKKHWLYFLGIPLIVAILSGGFIFPWMLYRVARYYFDEIVVTNQKFHIRIGLINKAVASTPLKNINNVTFQQGLLGRIFNYGTINVHSAALLGVSSYSYICNPELTKATIEQAIANQTTKVTLV